MLHGGAGLWCSRRRERLALDGGLAQGAGAGSDWREERDGLRRRDRQCSRRKDPPQAPTAALIDSKRFVSRTHQLPTSAALISRTHQPHSSAALISRPHQPHSSAALISRTHQPHSWCLFMVSFNGPLHISAALISCTYQPLGVYEYLVLGAAACPSPCLGRSSGRVGLGCFDLSRGRLSAQEMPDVSAATGGPTGAAGVRRGGALGLRLARRRGPPGRESKPDAGPRGSRGRPADEVGWGQGMVGAGRPGGEAGAR